MSISDFAVGPAQREEWLAAFHLALQHVDEPSRRERVFTALRLADAGEIDPAGILVARSHDTMIGAMVAVPLHGAGGLVWPPQTRPGDPIVEDRLVGASLDWLAAKGAKVVQALLPADEMPLAPALVRHGFRRITRLSYMRHDLDGSIAPSAKLRWESYDLASRDVFHETLLLTYEKTLDCPELNGVRNIEEIVAGHAAQGKFDPRQWWLAWAADRAVGVVLTTVAPDEGTWDLSYMGLVSGARGCGLGRELVMHALGAAQNAVAPALVLAVDERNAPAHQLYRSLGFHDTGFREVFLHVTRAPLAARLPPITVHAVL